MSMPIKSATISVSIGARAVPPEGIPPEEEERRRKEEEALGWLFLIGLSLLALAERKKKE